MRSILAVVPWPHSPTPHPPGFLTPCDSTWLGHQPPSPVPRPTHVPAAHTASDFGSAPGQTAAHQPGPSGGSLLPKDTDTHSPDPDRLQPRASPSFTHPLSRTFLSICSLALRPVPPARSRYRSDAWSRAWPPATVASSRQRQAPNTILPLPEKVYVEEGSSPKLHEATLRPPTHHGRQECFPIPLVWEPINRLAH